MVSYPWPESEQRVRARVRGLVESVVRPRELREVRLAWVRPDAPQPNGPQADAAALRVIVVAAAEEVFERDVWGPHWHGTWEDELSQLANDLEDWVCETSFAWGEQRTAAVPQ
jgi:hypothetical protein